MPYLANELSFVASEFAQAMGVILLVAIPLSAAQFVLFLVAIINVVKKPSTVGSERIVWVLIICLISIIGPIIYFAVGSNRLDEIAARNSSDDNNHNRF
ncbi:MAG: PLD nuclease N-terminal domain-containing protein [Defluviitaleaceae bacterium]|nr:PLD nuclease N-terminal domain-containing protein [Defluviitaleaceae bacterium]